MSENRVYVYARNIKRAFTFDEWADYLNEHPDSPNEVVFSEAGYDWNIHGVCRNPKVPVNIAVGNSYVIIKVAQSAGAWVVGHDYALRDCGGGSPVSYVGPNIHAFATEREAVLYELQQIIKAIDREPATATLSKLKGLIIQEIGKQKQVQLSLF